MSKEIIKKVWFSVGDDAYKYDHDTLIFHRKFFDIEDYVDYYINNIAEEYDRFSEGYYPDARTFKFYMTEDGPCVYQIEVESEAVIQYHSFSGMKP